MDYEQIPLLAQEFGIWFQSFYEDQTKHLIEAMPCLCAPVFDKVTEKYVGEKMCNRCSKLEEWK